MKNQDREPQSIPILRNEPVLGRDPMIRDAADQLLAHSRAGLSSAVDDKGRSMYLDEDKAKFVYERPLPERPLPNAHVLSANMNHSRAAIAWVFAERKTDARAVDLDAAEAWCSREPTNEAARAQRDEALAALSRACDLEEAAHRKMEDAAKALVAECER